MIRCEAKVLDETIQQGKINGMYDLSGRKVGLAKGVSESPNVIRTTITCEGCKLNEIFVSSGLGFVPHNESRRRVKSYLQQSCKKFASNPQSILAE